MPRLFETLDPTLRRVVLPSGRQVVLADTVGFISNLPTPLIKAFQVYFSSVLCSIPIPCNDDPGSQHPCVPFVSVRTMHTTS